MCKLVTIIEVEEEVSGGSVIIIVVIAWSAAQDDRGRRQAAVGEAGVDTWEASIGGEEGIQVGMRLDRGVRGGDALPRLLHGGDVAPVAKLRELHAAERRHPCTHPFTAICFTSFTALASGFFRPSSANAQGGIKRLSHLE